MKYLLLTTSLLVSVPAVSLDEAFLFDSEIERYRNQYKDHNVDLITDGTGKFRRDSYNTTSCDALNAIDIFIDATKDGVQSDQERQSISSNLLSECQTDQKESS